MTSAAKISIGVQYDDARERPMEQYRVPLRNVESVLTDYVRMFEQGSVDRLTIMVELEVDSETD